MAEHMQKVVGRGGEGRREKERENWSGFGSDFSKPGPSDPIFQ